MFTTQQRRLVMYTKHSIFQTGVGGGRDVADRIAFSAIQKLLKMSINDKNHYLLLWYVFFSMPIRWSVVIFILYNFSHTQFLWTLRNVFLEWLHLKVCEVHTNFIDLCNPKSTKIHYVMIICKVLWSLHAIYDNLWKNTFLKVSEKRLADPGGPQGPGPPWPPDLEAPVCNLTHK